LSVSSNSQTHLSHLLFGDMAHAEGFQGPLHIQVTLYQYAT
jgi:hypothetical protein